MSETNGHVRTFDPAKVDAIARHVVGLGVPVGLWEVGSSRELHLPIFDDEALAIKGLQGFCELATGTIVVCKEKEERLLASL